MKATMLGAAGEVTGSAYLVETSQAAVLVDFGLFQGSKLAEERNKVPKQLNLKKLNAIVLTHAHLDHTGRLPLLAGRGYRGPIYATPATIEITGLILRDAAHIQESEAERINRKRQRAGEDPIEPIFDNEDVDLLLPLIRPLKYETPTQLAPGISVRMFEAGHLLGSASIEMTIEDGQQRKTVVFSGDLGPRDMALLRDPARLEKADTVVLESTYGDRDHKPLAETLAEFHGILEKAVARKGKILVPAFAIGRTQQMLYHLAGMFIAGKVKPFPIYVDSPLAIAANELYVKHPELFDSETTELISNGKLRTNLATVHASQSADDSRALNNLEGPCLIMAGAGMCNAGRILHHLKHNLWRAEASVLIVGYQAPGSLGRLLIDGKKQVSIFGEKIAVNASVHSLGGFSAHAGQSDLMRWMESLAPARPKVVLTHGEEKGRAPLSRLIREKWKLDVTCPMLGEVIPLA